MSQAPIEIAYRRAQYGDHAGFADWVRLVERPLRTGLRSFASRVDVEAIVQESLLRMWVLAPRLELHGPDASLRYVRKLARNMALRESERMGRFDPIGERENEIDSGAVLPDAAPDPALRDAIVKCMKALPRRPKQVLMARLNRQPGEADRELASRLGLRVNNFLQNVVRARKALLSCLESHGISLPGVQG